VEAKEDVFRDKKFLSIDIYNWHIKKDIFK